MDAKSSQDELAEGFGQVLGELLGIVVGVTNAMRKQPGFDDGAFRKELEDLLDQPGISQFQEHALHMLLARKQ